jgi:glutathione S-transferase
VEKTTLTYFDAPTSRGEECRLALHLAGVPFTDDRIARGDWPSRRGATPFGAVPVLTVEGHPPIAQSNAILVLVGRQHGLHPRDDWDAAVHESIMGAVEDLRARTGPLARLKDEDEKRRARQELAAGYLQEWAAAIERQLGPGPFVAGEKIHVVDLKLFVVTGTFLRGAIDYIPADVFKAYPKLLRLAEAVRTHPKVVEWYEARARRS